MPPEPVTPDGGPVPPAAAAASPSVPRPGSPVTPWRDTARRPRRTRARVLAAVTAAVDAMCADGERGPASLLVTRMGERGVKVTEATLRSGDCRAQLERVWVRRKGSVRSFGPTGGHDLRPVPELVEHVIDLKWRIGRVRADMRGEAFSRDWAPERDPRSVAACARHEGDVARRAALIAELLPGMASAGVFPNYDTVSGALGEAGEPLTARTLRRNEAYWRPILKFLGIEPPMKPVDPERVALLGKSSEELGAMVYALIAELAEVEREFVATFQVGKDDLVSK